MKPWSAFSAVLWMLTLSCPLIPLAASDTALVIKKSNLRKDPSAQHTPIRVLLPDEELTILDSTTAARYLKVKTEDKKTGWVWKGAVQILPDTAGNAPITPFHIADCAILFDLLHHPRRTRQHAAGVFTHSTTSEGTSPHPSGCSRNRLS